MAEFEVGGHHYRTDKMSGREQLHLTRCLGPLADLMVEFSLLPQSDMLEADRNVYFIARFFRAFGKMEEAEVNTLLNKCYAVTHRREGGNGTGLWGPPLWSVSAAREQYSDIDLPSIITICREVIQENLGGFFGFGIGSSPPTSVAAETPTQPASPS